MRQADFNSPKVPSSSVLNTIRPVGANTRANSVNSLSRSAHHCTEKLAYTAVKLAGANGRLSASRQTSALPGRG